MEIIAGLERSRAALYRLDRQGCAGRRCRVQCRDPDPGAARGETVARLGLGSGIVADSVAATNGANAWRRESLWRRPELRPDRDDALRSARRHRRARPPSRADEASADALGFAFDRHHARNELQAATFRCGKPQAQAAPVAQRRDGDRDRGRCRRRPTRAGRGGAGAASGRGGGFPAPPQDQRPRASTTRRGRRRGRSRWPSSTSGVSSPRAASPACSSSGRQAADAAAGARAAAGGAARGADRGGAGGGGGSAGGGSGGRLLRRQCGAGADRGEA
jgi:hypothetical protein